MITTNRHNDFNSTALYIKIKTLLKTHKKEFKYLLIGLATIIVLFTVITLFTHSNVKHTPVVINSETSLEDELRRKLDDLKRENEIRRRQEEAFDNPSPPQPPPPPIQPVIEIEKPQQQQKLDIQQQQQQQQQQKQAPQIPPPPTYSLEELKLKRAEEIRKKIEDSQKQLEQQREQQVQLRRETLMRMIHEISRVDEENIDWVDTTLYPKSILDKVLLKGDNMSPGFETAQEEFDELRKLLLDRPPVDWSEREAELMDQPILPLLHPKFTMSVNVITYNRPRSLKRLCMSLNNAEYYGHKLNVNFFVEKGADEETKQVIRSFEWTQGEKRIFMRHKRSGLVPAVLESWYPDHEHDYVLLAEDDIELSKYWYLWILELMKVYRYPSIDPKTGKPRELDSHIFGVSLYTPRESENSMPRFMYYPDQNFKQTAWLHQIPCSWGAVYFPEHWRYYRHFIEMRRNVGKNINIPYCECNGWTGSWVKFYTELAYLKGWYMIYPNFANQTSFSTNHMEPGVHIQLQEFEHKKEAFEVPLADTNIVPVGLMPDINELPILDYKYQKYINRKELQEVSRYSWYKFLIELKGKEKRVK
jgi:hypothetical protein